MKASFLTLCKQSSINHQSFMNKRSSTISRNNIKRKEKTSQNIILGLLHGNLQVILKKYHTKSNRIKMINSLHSSQRFSISMSLLIYTNGLHVAYTPSNLMFSRVNITINRFQLTIRALTPRRKYCGLL